MSAGRYFKSSPAKKARPGGATASSVSSGGGREDFIPVGEFIDDRLCPDEDCGPPRGRLLWRTNAGRPFAACSNNPKNNPGGSCTFTANKLGRDKNKAGDSKITCICCLHTVADKLSLGRKTGATDPDTKKPTYDNIHLFFDECVGKRAEDPLSKQVVLSQLTAAAQPVLGTVCEAYEENGNEDEDGDVCTDQNKGCTKFITSGDLVVRSWMLKEEPKGLHAKCAKRMHAALVKPPPWHIRNLSSPWSTTPKMLILLPCKTKLPISITSKTISTSTTLKFGLASSRI